MLKSGHRIVPVVGKEQEKQVKDFKYHTVGTVRLEPGGWFFKLPFIEFANENFEYKFRPSDVVVMTFPKCGTTWTQEIVWTMLHNGDLNHPLADAPVNIRAPFIDADCCIVHEAALPKAPGDEFFDMFSKLCPGKNIEDGLFQQILDNLPDPRVIKTHLPFSLLTQDLLDTCKVVYVARDPRDVAVSYYHHLKVLKTHGFVGTMDDLVDHFVNDTLIWSPFWTHIKEAWNRRSHPNLHFIYYEDMKEDPRREVVRLQKFVGTDLNDKQIDDIVKYTSFTEMKKRDNAMGKIASEKHEDNPFVDMEFAKEAGGAFFRKGNAGDWKNKLTAEQVAKLEEWTNKNTKSFGPDFKYGCNTEKRLHDASQMNGKVAEYKNVNGRDFEFNKINGTVSESKINGTLPENNYVNGTLNNMNGTLYESTNINGTVHKSKRIVGTLRESTNHNGTGPESTNMNGTVPENNHTNGTAYESANFNGTGPESTNLNDTAYEYNHVNGTMAGNNHMNGTMAENNHMNGTITKCSKIGNKVAKCNKKDKIEAECNQINGTGVHCNGTNGTIA